MRATAGSPFYFDADWLRYLVRFLAAVGALLIVAGIAAFFAWNWADLP